MLLQQIITSLIRTGGGAIASILIGIIFFLILLVGTTIIISIVGEDAPGGETWPASLQAGVHEAGEFVTPFITVAAACLHSNCPYAHCIVII